MWINKWIGSILADISELYDKSLIWLNLGVLSYVGYLSMCRSKGLAIQEIQLFNDAYLQYSCRIPQSGRIGGDLAVLYQFEATCKSQYPFTIANYKDVTITKKKYFFLRWSFPT